jgi:hypothetical protein
MFGSWRMASSCLLHVLHVLNATATYHDNPMQHLSKACMVISHAVGGWFMPSKYRASVMYGEYAMVCIPIRSRNPNARDRIPVVQHRSCEACSPWRYKAHTTCMMPVGHRHYYRHDEYYGTMYDRGQATHRCAVCACAHTLMVLHHGL